jgi:hypothetical protein
MRRFIAYCLLASAFMSSAPVNSAEPPSLPLASQPVANPPLPNASTGTQPSVLGSGAVAATADEFSGPTPTPAIAQPRSLRFRNATAGEVTVSLQADQKDEPTTIKCRPGSVAAFTITSDGPFEVTFQTDDQRFSRSRLDLHALRRRMRGDMASIRAMADLETDIDAVENKKVTSTLGALYVTFPANVPGGVLQALFPISPEYRAVPEAAPPAPSPSPNPPEARSPQPKTP